MQRERYHGWNKGRGRGGIKREKTSAKLRELTHELGHEGNRRARPPQILDGIALFKTLMARKDFTLLDHIITWGRKTGRPAAMADWMLADIDAAILEGRAFLADRKAGRA